MKAITIHQPWAWAIIYSSKDIDNRSWPTRYRGPLLIHAASSMKNFEYDDFAEISANLNLPRMPQRSELQLGGIIGIVDLVDCVEEHKSPWFRGEYGFVLKNAKPLPFVRLPGKLNLFEVDNNLLKAA